jgi:hypothetical protein
MHQLEPSRKREVAIAPGKADLAQVAIVDGQHGVTGDHLDLVETEIAALEGEQQMVAAGRGLIGRHLAFSCGILKTATARSEQFACTSRAESGILGARKWEIGLRALNRRLVEAQTYRRVSPDTLLRA